MFRFTIRDLLWLTVGVGLSVGWWLDHRQLGDYARRKQQGHNDYCDQTNKSLLSEAGRIARETGEEVTIKTPYVIFVGKP